MKVTNSSPEYIYASNLVSLFSLIPNKVLCNTHLVDRYMGEKQSNSGKKFTVSTEFRGKKYNNSVMDLGH